MNVNLIEAQIGHGVRHTRKQVDLLVGVFAEKGVRLRGDVVPAEANRFMSLQIGGLYL